MRYVLQSPKVLQQVANLPRKSILAAQAKAVEVLMRGHFKERQAEGNKRGWPLPKFWYGAGGTVANATAVGEVNNDFAEVVVADARFNQKVYGGTITAKRSRNLAIPLTAQAAKLSARMGSIRELDLKLVVTKKGAYLAREAYEQRGTPRRKGVGAKGVARQRLQFWFKLTRSVTQSADPRALPPSASFDQTILDATAKIVPLLLKKGGGNA